MEVDLLKQIVKNTAHKTSFQIIVGESKSRMNEWSFTARRHQRSYWARRI